MARTDVMHFLQRAVRAHARSALSEPAPTDLTRRAVLSGAGALAFSAALPATGLAATAKIAIVGAGLAGLTAAYQLQKAGYTPDVFEASSRLGGRCYSARGIFANGQIAEHGGEFIDTGHKEIRQLAHTLGLVLDDVLAATPSRLHPVYLFDGRPYSLADATRDWQPVYPVLQAQSAAIGDFSYKQSTPDAQRLDAMTISDWIAAHVPGGRSSRLGQLLENAFVEENGADADQQSALNLIGVLAMESKDKFDLYATYSDQRFHVRGGNDQIPARLAKALHRPVKTASPLIAVAQLPNAQIRLSFKRDTGSADLVYDRVILALPFSIMRGSVDTRNAGFRALKSRAIATLPMGASVKCQLQFDRRLWSDINCTGEIRLPATGFQTTWEVTRAQPGATGILNFWSGGSKALFAGQTAPAELAALVMREAEPAIPNLAKHWNGRMTKDAWKDNPWSLGSWSYYPPGYQTTVAGIEGESEGHIFFAGEHTAEENGYLNAAVQTGLRAAGEVAQSLSKK